MGADTDGRPRISRRTLIVLGAVLLSVVGAVVALAHQGLTRGPRVMIVEIVDANGVPVGQPEVVTIPEPARVSENGLSQLRPQVARMLASPARFTSLLVSTPDQQRGVGLHYTGGRSASRSTWSGEGNPARSGRSGRSLRASTCRRRRITWRATARFRMPPGSWCTRFRATAIG